MLFRSSTRTRSTISRWHLVVQDGTAETVARVAMRSVQNLIPVARAKDDSGCLPEATTKYLANISSEELRVASSK